MKYLFFFTVSYFLLLSNADAQWKRMSGLDTSYVSTFVAFGDTLLACTGIGPYPDTTGEGIFRSTDIGATWNSVHNSPEAKDIASIAWIGDTMIATTRYGYIIRSADHGITWVSTGAREAGMYGTSVLAIGDTLFCTSSEVYRSTDKGTTWLKISNQFSNTLSILYNLDRLGNLLFLATSHGIFYTSNSGDSWVRSGDSVIGTDRFESMAIKDTNIFVTCVKGFFRSQDTGKTWQLITGLIFNRFAFLDDIYFAGSGLSNNLVADGQFDHSTDGGVTWIYNEGLPKDKYETALFAFKGYVFAAMGSGGIWRRKISEYSSVPKKAEAYPTIENYPNPFASNTTITFTLPIPAEVTISISDALGHEKNTLIPPTHYEAGTQYIQWDGSDYPNGVYTVRIVADGIREIRKMVLVK